MIKNYNMQQSNQKELSGVGKIYAGEIHYSRIPVEYWEHRILMIKAMGLNALSVYIMWNYHQISRGEFDFQTDNKNLPLFLQLASKHKMMVLFRPGPYVCAQWDFGGLPARLLSVNGLVIRSNNIPFLQQTRLYFQALVPIMKKHLRNKKNPKGCIVMLQIQNQYGFYGVDKSYMEAIRAIWKQLCIVTNQYYVDWPFFIKRCHWQGANIGINHFDSKNQQRYVRYFQKKGIIMGGQIYTGWMTHWTERWGGKKVESVSNNFKFLLQNGNSFAMYVAHGGTNFGLTAGANGLSKISDYWGAITSYDYDAPINQQGSVTNKYLVLRELIKKYVKWQVPQIPKPIQMITINEIKVKKYANLFQNLPNQALISQIPFVFQSHQLQMFSQGMVLYETSFQKTNKNIYIKMVVHDFALVYLGDKLIEVLDRTRYTNHGLTILKEDLQPGRNILRILVQASGHINFDKNMESDYKGLYYFGGDLQDLQWTMYKFPVQFSVIKKFKPLKQTQVKNLSQDFPLVLKGEFNLQKTGDVYLDVKDFGKGYVWVNGRNLGRYWNVGPQSRLFCPGVWLKKGNNQIHILNVWGPCGSSLKGHQKLREQQIPQNRQCNIM